MILTHGDTISQLAIDSRVLHTQWVFPIDNESMFRYFNVDLSLASIFSFFLTKIHLQPFSPVVSIFLLFLILIVSPVTGVDYTELISPVLYSMLCFVKVFNESD